MSASRDNRAAQRPPHEAAVLDGAHPAPMRPRATVDDWLVRALAPRYLLSLHPSWRFLLAVLIAAAATGLRLALVPWLGTNSPFGVAYAAIAITAVLLGTGPGLLSVPLSALAVEAFLMRSLHAPLGGVPLDRLAIALVIGFFLCALLHAVRVAELKAREGEVAARRARDEWERTFDSVPDLIAILDKEHRIVRANRAMAERLGAAAESCAGLRCYSCVHGADAPVPGCPHSETLRDGKEHSAEVHEERLGGDFLVTTTPLFDDDGTMTGAVHVARDITASKRAAEALRQARDELEQRVAERTAELAASSHLLEAFFEHALVSFVLLDRDFNFLRVNRTYADACQRDMSEFPGHNHFEFYPNAENRAIFEEVVRSKQPFQVAARAFVFPDHPAWGTTYWDWTLVPVLDDAGEVGCLVFSLRDVTKDHMAEQELHAASRYARSLLEASLDPLVTISPEGRITDVNEATERITGVPRPQLIGSRFSDYFTEPAKAEAGYQEVISAGEIRDYPLTIRHVSGRTTDVLYNATVYRNEAGESQGVFATARDVTERNRAEAELARYRDHLEDLVQQRTAELTRSNEELAQFAYVASHDLQEPLRAVTGYLSLIEVKYADRLDDAGRRHIDGAVQGAKRMHDLITDLLTLSRVGTRGKPPEPADFEHVLDAALTNLSASVREAGARITRDPLPVLPVDAGQIALLFQNLVGNAIKFRSERPPAIHVGAEEQDDRWVFSVRDNGIGIAPEYFERIFLIFQRLHTRRQHPGTGIGLAIARKIAERHGGTIWVESQPGEGSTFRFTIPKRGTS